MSPRSLKGMIHGVRVVLFVEQSRGTLESINWRVRVGVTHPSAPEVTPAHIRLLKTNYIPVTVVCYIN